MGQTLSSPATDKDTEYGVNERFLYALTSMQGWRITMEDAHIAKLKLDESKSDLDADAFFAVYDGHGGANVAKYIGQNLWKRIADEQAYKDGDYRTALKTAFLSCDADMKANPDFTRDTSGCTAVGTLVTHDGRVFCANAGDSRAIICSKGVAKELSIDHKPKLESERRRIVSAGGYVEYGRVNGNLALSRAFGDFEYKKNKSLSPEDQIITCDPEILEHQITEDDEFIVIACDGIWDCLNSQQVADFVRGQVAQGKDLAKIAEDMCEHCLSPGTDSGEGIGADNMTVLIVALLHDKSPKEWAQWVTRRVEKGYGYKTPLEPARIWPESRIQEGRRKRELYTQREVHMKARASAPVPEAADLAGRRWSENEDLYARMHSGPPLWDMSARILGSNGGISFRPGSIAVKDLHNLMFDDDDDEDMNVDEHETKGGKTGAGKHVDGMDEGSDEEVFDDVSDWNGDTTTSAFLSGYPLGSDATKGLREQLEELEKDEDGRAATPTQGRPTRQGEAPPPPPPSAAAETAPPESQLPPAHLSGDAPSDVVKAEGLMDKSEDPLKA